MRSHTRNLKNGWLLVLIVGGALGGGGLMGRVAPRAWPRRSAPGLTQFLPASAARLDAFSQSASVWSQRGGAVAGVLVVSGTAGAPFQFALAQGPHGLRLDLNRLHFAATAAQAGQGAPTPPAVVLEGRALTLRRGRASLALGVGCSAAGQVYRQLSVLVIGAPVQVLLNLTQPVGAAQDLAVLPWSTRP